MLTKTPALGPREAKIHYRKCVGLMLFNPHGDIFVGQRRDRMVEAWQMPQGGIDAGEAEDTAAFREMKEEIGTDKAEVVTKSVDWLAYDLPNDLQGKLWKGKYRGQIQRWYLLRFIGDDSDINIETEHPEFRSWRWCSPAELLEMAVPFKRGVYSEVLRRFAGPLKSALLAQ